MFSCILNSQLLPVTRRRNGHEGLLVAGPVSEHTQCRLTLPQVWLTNSNKFLLSKWRYRFFEVL